MVLGGRPCRRYRSGSEVWNTDHSLLQQRWRLERPNPAGQSDQRDDRRSRVVSGSKTVRIYTRAPREELSYAWKNEGVHHPDGVVCPDTRVPKNPAAAARASDIRSCTGQIQ